MYDKKYTNNITNDPTFRVIGCAIEVHRQLGPGLLESTYEQCLAYEFSQNGISYKRQEVIPIKYKELELNCGYRIDLLIENCLILEMKVVDRLIPIHYAQLLTYMKLATLPIGLLINFNAMPLKNGIKRFLL